MWQCSLLLLLLLLLTTTKRQPMCCHAATHDCWTCVLMWAQLDRDVSQLTLAWAACAVVEAPAPVLLSDDSATMLCLAAVRTASGASKHVIAGKPHHWVRF